MLVAMMLLLTSCVTNIENMPQKQLSYAELPDTVRKIYQYDALDTVVDFEYKVVTTDTAINFKHEHTGMDDGILTLITRGFNHHFYIGDRHFKLEANKGSPFILHDKHLYYSTELNLSDDNYKQANYVEVELVKYLK